VKIEGGSTFDNYNTLVRPLLRGASNLKVNVRSKPGQIVLAWPATEFGYAVEAASALTGGLWSRASVSFSEVNNENTATVGTSEPAMFLPPTQAVEFP